MHSQPKKSSKNDSPPSPFNSEDLQARQDEHDKVLAKNREKMVDLVDRLIRDRKSKDT